MKIEDLELCTFTFVDPKGNQGYAVTVTALSEKEAAYITRKAESDSTTVHEYVRQDLLGALTFCDFTEDS